MKTKLQQDNDARLAQLHGIDHLYAEELVSYLRSHTGRDYVALENSIGDILDDLADATAHGHSAKEYFGQDAQGAANTILQTIPRAGIGQLLTLWLPIMVYLLAIYVFPPFLQRAPRVGLGTLAVIAVITLLLVVAIPRMTALDEKKQNRAALFFILSPVIVGLLAGFAQHWADTQLTVPLTWPATDIVLLAVALLTGATAVWLRPLWVLPLPPAGLGVCAALYSWGLNAGPWQRTLAQLGLYWTVMALLGLGILFWFIWVMMHRDQYRIDLSESGR
ncbi:hypothetical protein [Schleiferilactobacillus shenzhenensis]|uniref:Uncharacterized protein n=1 Tax=Schleiferilactobacillus shenzhenensis LY-73 TaxID=1231336 RepID=U4TGZ7_9LACO|nr:hypothetical protein [Schleiferilactobacillus shenzhenensis]ERL64066.1 hypothetical protein L248_1599 [Schleiferilactobacillus shenzhenensis LY-73]